MLSRASIIGVPGGEKAPHEAVAARGVDRPVEYDTWRELQARQDHAAGTQERRCPETDAVPDERAEVRAPRINEVAPKLHAHGLATRGFRVGHENVSGDVDVPADDGVTGVHVMTEEAIRPKDHRARHLAVSADHAFGTDHHLLTQDRPGADAATGPQHQPARFVDDGASLDDAVGSREE